MEIKVGGIYRTKDDLHCFNGSVLPKGVECKVISISHIFTPGRNIVEDSLLKQLWNVSSSELEEVETMEKAKNMASKGPVLKDAILEEQENLLAKAMEQEVSKRVAEIQHDAREDLEKDKNIIRKIADHYGPAHQGNKLMEEIGELITASTKSDIDHFVEEMADVSIMIEQMAYLLEKESLFAETREKKIARQIKRIEDEEMDGERNCLNCKNFPVAIHAEPCKNCFNTKMRSNWEKDEK